MNSALFDLLRIRCPSALTNVSRASFTFKKNTVSVSANISILSWPVARRKSLLPSLVTEKVNSGVISYTPAYGANVFSSSCVPSADGMALPVLVHASIPSRLLVINVPTSPFAFRANSIVSIALSSMKNLSR